jgi:hypothetical protein
MAHPLVNQHNRTQIGLSMGLFHESSQEMLDDISSGPGIGKNVYFGLTGDNSNQYLHIPNGPPVNVAELGNLYFYIYTDFYQAEPDSSYSDIFNYFASDNSIETFLYDETNYIPYLNNQATSIKMRDTVIPVHFDKEYYLQKGKRSNNSQM